MRPTSLAVLRHREFRLLFAGQSVSLLGDGMVNVALAFAVLSIGGSASAVGLVFAVRLIPMVACLLVGGVVADRTSRRAVMIVADLVRLGAHGAMAALLVAGAAEVWSLALLAGAAGAATGFFNPAATGLLPALVGPGELQQANGLRVTAMASGEIAGPLIAGLLVATVGAGWALAVDAATFGVSAGYLAALRLPAGAARTRDSFAADLVAGWRAFRSRRWVWAFVASAALGNACWGAWTALGPVIADREIGGAAAWGAVLSAMGVGGVLGGLLAIRARPRHPLVVASLAGAVFAVPLALLAAGAPLALLAAGALVAGFALMVGESLWESTLQREVPPEALSRVSAYDWFGSLAGKPVGLAAFGPLAVALGAGTALWIAFAVLVVSSLSVLAVADVRRIEDRTAGSGVP